MPIGPENVLSLVIYWSSGIYNALGSLISALRTLVSKIKTDK